MTLDESNETIVVNISSVTNSTESGIQQGTTITDDDTGPTVTLAIAPSSIAEAAGTATVTATLSAISAQNVIVDLAYSGTATNISDYVRSGTQIVILAGSTSGTVTLPTVQDSLNEVNETIIVDISGVTNGIESGTQRVTATIIDDDGLLANPGFVGLVDDPQDPGQKILIVNGTIASDTIYLWLRNFGQEIEVRLNNVTVGIFERVRVNLIVVNGFAGNDFIYLDQNLGKSAVLHGNEGKDTIYAAAGNDQLFGDAGDDYLFGGVGLDRLYGGDGNDHLFGQDGHDILLGGNGNDWLYGGLDRDILIGGRGTDSLFGESGDDILIGGRTAHDDNPTALSAILAEWTSGNSYETRVSNIRNGLGQSYGNSLSAGVTVFDDGVVLVDDR